MAVGGVIGPGGAPGGRIGPGGGAGTGVGTVVGAVALAQATGINNKNKTSSPIIVFLIISITSYVTPALQSHRELSHNPRR